MSNQTDIHHKRELLTEQIANLEQSGFFTEAEIERLSRPIKAELEQLENEASTLNNVM